MLEPLTPKQIADIIDRSPWKEKDIQPIYKALFRCQDRQWQAYLAREEKREAKKRKAQ